MLRGKHGARLEFLRKRSLPNLPEDKPGVREDVVKDWNHIHETVRIVSKTFHHAIFYRWEILECLKLLTWSEARFLQVQMAGIWGSQCQICPNISFFPFWIDWQVQGPCSSTLCTTSLAYQLADNLEMFTDSEICHIIKVIKGKFISIKFLYPYFIFIYSYIYTLF